VRQEARERVLELRRPITMPREIGSLSRMNDDGTNIIVSQQRRDLVFGDRASAAILMPRRVWIGDKLLNRPSASSMIRVGCSRSTVRYTLGPVGSTLTNGFGTRKRRTPSRVLLPESGSTEIAARMGECVVPSCAHAVIVHSPGEERYNKITF
jgi:hypothetical protein